MDKYPFFNQTTGLTLTRYRSHKGLISLAPPAFFTMAKYEIYCLEGNLFEDIERYGTLQEAEARIVKLLEEEA